jgi:predicted dehydrogenase
MKKAGAPLYVGFCYRFSPAALNIRELVVSRAAGEIRSLRLVYIWNVHGKFETAPDGKRRIQKRREDRMLEGGPMVDCGAHQIDLAHFWLDSPVVRFTGIGAWVDEYEAPDHLWLHIDHACGAHTLVEISYSYCHTAQAPRHEFTYDLIGDQGLIRYDREAKRFTLYTGAGTTELPFAEEKNFTGLYAEFAKALKSGKPGLLTTAEQALEVTRIAREATNEAIKNRKTEKTVKTREPKKR